MKTVCIKIGGSTVDSEGLLDELARGIKLVAGDYFSVVVHGGGKAIARMLDLMKKEFSFVEGMRVTDAETLDMVQMVLSGGVNKQIVAAFRRNGVKALGMSGVDCDLFTVEKTLMKGKDIGLVGTVVKVDTTAIDVCRTAGIVPIVSPVSMGADKLVYNVNADPAASTCAESIKADDLIYVSDVEGVLVGGAVRHSIRTDEVELLIADRHITGGMVPKVRSAAQAVHNGVGRVHICGWHGAGTLAQELSEQPSGTVIHK